MLIALAPVLIVFPASADPWIPAAGTGKVKSVLRLYRSDRTFSSSHFGSETFPSTSKISETQLKVTGEHGLGDGWALQYDLRAAQESKTKTKKNISTTYTASGLQDQEIGLVRGLRQGEVFADAIALNIILPTGSASSNPQLGVGHTAIEPDYQFGIKHQFGQRTCVWKFFHRTAHVFQQQRDAVARYRRRGYPAVSERGHFWFPVLRANLWRKHCTSIQRKSKCFGSV